jgi:hypothetical protein
MGKNNAEKILRKKVRKNNFFASSVFKSRFSFHSRPQFMALGALKNRNTNWESPIRAFCGQADSVKECFPEHRKKVGRYKATLSHGIFNLKKSYN